MHYIHTYTGFHMGNIPQAMIKHSSRRDSGKHKLPLPSFRIISKIEISLQMPKLELIRKHDCTLLLLWDSPEFSLLTKHDLLSPHLSPIPRGYASWEMPSLTPRMKPWHNILQQTRLEYICMLALSIATWKAFIIWWLRRRTMHTLNSYMCMKVPISKSAECWRIHSVLYIGR